MAITAVPASGPQLFQIWGRSMLLVPRKTSGHYADWKTPPCQAIEHQEEGKVQSPLELLTADAKLAPHVTVHARFVMRSHSSGLISHKARPSERRWHCPRKSLTCSTPSTHARESAPLICLCSVPWFLAWLPAHLLGQGKENIHNPVFITRGNVGLCF